jgi:hypothetical protein
MQNKNLLNQLIEYVANKLGCSHDRSNRVIHWIFTPNALKPTVAEHVYWSNTSCEYVLSSTRTSLDSHVLVITKHEYDKLYMMGVPHVDLWRMASNRFMQLYKDYNTKHSPQSSDTQKQSISTESNLNKEPMKMDRTQCYGVLINKHTGVILPVGNVRDLRKTYRTNLYTVAGVWSKPLVEQIYHKDDYVYESLVLTTKEAYVTVSCGTLREKARLIATNCHYAIVFVNNIYLGVLYTEIVNWSVPAEDSVYVTLPEIPELYIPAMGDYVEVEHPQYSAFGKVVALNDQWIAVEAPNLVITTFEIEQCSITRSSCKKTMLRTKLLRYRYDVDNLEIYVDSIDQMYQGQ